MPPIVVPIIKNIHATVYAAASSPKSLDMKDWHTCENTHYRAKLVVTLAGEAAKALELRFNTDLAARLIYAASSPDLPISPAWFYNDNDAALADMKRLADLESKS